MYYYRLVSIFDLLFVLRRISWVHKFLDKPLSGLDVLIEYLTLSLNFMREADRVHSETMDAYAMHAPAAGNNGLGSKCHLFEPSPIGPWG